MSLVAGPVLISIGALVGLLAIGWLLSGWLQDQYSIPLTHGDEHPRSESPPE